ncbi:hypothetical protein QCA50_014145 [Cerrena zonata]|uniref:DUF6534 domain-containing protein n=1 Tax=Cerrena zonata TaxID=2478898 RepID=A0AAW0FRP8_9APHY
MIYYLRRRQPHFRRTRGIASWLVLYFVSTGAILVALSGTVVIIYLANVSDLLWCGIVIIYSRALANSFFGALNARQVLRNKQGEVITFGGVSMRNNAMTTPYELRRMQVRIVQDTTIKTDSRTTLHVGDDSTDVKTTNSLSHGHDLTL